MYIFNQTFKEYFLSVIFSTLFLLAIPQDSASILQQGLISLLTIVPMTMINILIMNLLTMILIIFCGIIKIQMISFFIVLNGTALGIMISIYKNMLNKFIEALFPHTIIETILILVFCSLVKFLSISYRNKKKSDIKKYWVLILSICIPLWLLAGYLEIH